MRGSANGTAPLLNQQMLMKKIVSTGLVMLLYLFFLCIENPGHRFWVFRKISRFTIIVICKFVNQLSSFPRRSADFLDV